MTSNDGDPSVPATPSLPESTAAEPAGRYGTVAQLPPDVAATLARKRRALARRTPAEHTPETTFAEKILSLALLSTPPTPRASDHGVDAILVQHVDGQLRTWLIQAKRAPYGHQRERARLGIFAALNARRAILETPTLDGWKLAVSEFATTWLGIPHADEQWLEAVSTALLGDWVDLLDEYLGDDAGDLGLMQLKKESAVVHRQLQPLWRRKAAGGGLLSLDYPVPGGGRLVDLLADRVAPEPPTGRWEPESERAAAVFAQLAPGEQHLARVWAQSPRTSWAEAADLAGATAADADGVRRKLRRLGIRHQQRKAAARSTRERALPGTAGSGE
ncbi:hypothetical protein ABZ313_35400 [Streptomyces sp. NPDC006251]|uniref:hypothetical protein n=1 Tax=Streptomyces sp. NPDC006251 TaxID=3155718 RepID=UPI0033B9BB33